MNRIVVAPLPEPGERIVVDQAGSHHLLHTQRVARGATVHATDGAGTLAETTLVDVQGGHAVLLVTARRIDAPPTERIVLLGLPRAPAAEDAMIAGTELGATTILMVTADRSPPGVPRADRIDRLLRTAVTQCGRATLPQVRGPMSLDDAIAASPGSRFYAHPGGSGVPWIPGAASVAVGPEGGWSEAEVSRLEAAGFQAIGLGPYLLRTATAVGAALAVLQPRS